MLIKLLEAIITQSVIKYKIQAVFAITIQSYVCKLFDNVGIQATNCSFA